MSKAQEQADIQRAEAKRMLNSALGLPENISSGAIDRAVDCIINAVILEAVTIINQGLCEQQANRPTSENP